MLFFWLSFTFLSFKAQPHIHTVFVYVQRLRKSQAERIQGYFIEYILTSPLDFTDTPTAPKDVFTAQNGIHF
ncbi:hypothetical protein BDV39DRAFT_184860, partial [Aspergillus sergii]